MSGVLRFDRAEILELLKKCKATDELMLVGDHGVYIMCMSHAVEERIIVYAQGCNPKKDTNFWDNKCDVFGGDDGADVIGLASELFTVVWGAKKYLLVKMTSEYMQLGRQ